MEQSLRIKTATRELEEGLELSSLTGIVMMNLSNKLRVGVKLLRRRKEAIKILDAKIKNFNSDLDFLYL